MLLVGHWEYLHVMAIYVNSSGQPIINSSGAPIDCSHCPCDEEEEGTITACHNDLVSACMSIPVAGFTDNGGDAQPCGPVLCSDKNDTWVLNWVSGTTWQDTKAIACPGGECVDTIIATLSISSLPGFLGPCFDANKCLWRLTMGGDNAEEDCGGSTTVWEACFPKTDDPMTPKVLTLLSNGAMCSTPPATVTVSPC